MILGIGTDVIEIDRIKKAIQNPAFLERVFSPNERTYCNGRGKQAFASYAARFAGKEAVMKALGTGLSGGKLVEIEIMPDAKGKPVVSLTGAFDKIANEIGVQKIYLSLSHCREYATAQAVVWGK
ncbi:holo-ACP synthase [Azotosporobacter soli]|uniref:holo-ACP synthase n=1 Tax=Azotosporobacter soli TaxID=3055040 RepID=UPI0031FF3748